MVEMKNSEIEWIGEIPKDWKVIRNKYVMSKDKKLISRYNNEDILSLTMNGVIKRDLNAGGKMPSSFNGYQKINKGNLLFCLFDIDVTPRCIGIINNNGITSPAYSQFILKPKNDVRFYYYYYLITDNDKALVHLSKNLRHSLTEEQFGNINTIRPPFSQQKAIANFLDNKCAEVDKIVKNIQQEINTLIEYKESFITELLTQGIDNGEEKKESNIDWIGKINKNCEVIRLKFLLKEPLKYGANESGINFNPDYPRYIRITDITSDSRLKTKGKLSLLPEQAEGYILKNNTILFARSGGTVGKSFLYKKSMGKAAFAGYLISAVINENIVDPKWVYYFTKSSIYTIWVNMIFSRATIQNIGADKYADLPVVVNLNKKMQKKTLSLLDDKVHAINKIIQQKKKLLNALEEFKQSLIYEYVTGKKQVPNVGEN